MKPYLLLPGFLVVACVIVCLAFCVYLVLKGLQEKQDQFAFAAKLISDAPRIAAYVNDAERVHRGFLITGNTQVLDQFTTSVQATWRVFNECADFATPELRNQLGSLITEKFGELSFINQIRMVSGFSEARSYVQCERNASVCAKIRQAVEQLEDELYERRAEAEKAYRCACVSAFAMMTSLLLTTAGTASSLVYVVIQRPNW